MSEKRRISVRKVIQTLVTILVVTGCTIAILSADHLQSKRTIRNIAIHLRNSNRVHFLDSAQVMGLLFSDRHIDPGHTSISKLDVHKLETIARTNPWVSDAQVFIDNERDVHIFVTQRIPVARLFEDNGNSYYLDTSLRTMPVSTSYVHYTPVITGIPPLRDDSTGLACKGEILVLVNYIAQHPFWNAQIAQIAMANKTNFELIPVLGKQRILFGDTSRMDEKFSNLFSFYQQVSNKVGWDKYETIDLRYKDQVVASPNIKWKIPVDRALSNMNWVKAVLESGDKNEKDEAAVTDAGISTPATTATATTATVATALKPATPAPARPLVTSASVKPKPTAFSGDAKPEKHTVHEKPKTIEKIKTDVAKADSKKTVTHAHSKPVLAVAKKDRKPADKKHVKEVKKTEKNTAKKPPGKTAADNKKKSGKDKKKTSSKAEKHTTNH